MSTTGGARSFLKKIPVQTQLGIFVLETSSRGLYRIRFPKICQGKGSISILYRKLRGRKLDLTGYTPFQRKIYTALVKVPPGKTVSYGELAGRVGYPGAARAAGTAMKENRLPIAIPCHRVLPVGGGIGEYSAGVKWKKFLLECEKALACQSVNVSTRHKVGP